jgi:hypothetical protein
MSIFVGLSQNFPYLCDKNLAVACLAGQVELLTCAVGCVLFGCFWTIGVGC